MTPTKKLSAAALAGMLGLALTATSAYAAGEHRDWTPNNPSHAVSRVNYCVSPFYWSNDGMNNCEGRYHHRMHDRDGMRDGVVDRDRDGRDDRTGRRY